LKKLLIGLLALASLSSYASEQKLTEIDFKKIKETVKEYAENNKSILDRCDNKDIADVRVELPSTATLSEKLLVSSTQFLFRCTDNSDFIEGGSCVVVKNTSSVNSSWLTDDCDL
jgi:hypothetical protein